MADYDNKSTGALFKNDKGDNPKRPDYTGSYTDENGKEFRVSAWVKQDKKGNDYMSFNTQPKEAQTPKPAQAHTPKQEYESDSKGDLPF
jgi:hypothetical protein